MNILSIGASSSSKSINQQFADYAASTIEHAKRSSYPLRGIQMPIYSEDEESQHGIPQEAQQFLDTIHAHDAVILSLAEHNGSYTAAFKNLLDWTSRINQTLWSEKPMLLLSTSPGARGGSSVLAAATASFPHLGANIVATMSLPSFYENFGEDGITNNDLASQLNQAVNELIQSVTTS
ncbi:NAD(P)H-dependent oxidoreductase [Verrucomicrobiaceae bacterium N1E253]|uniref:NAD(P)H-dependent oxidoreductase n=1 Tax=Oceaniferula marina TaxID=2748318 RepID=A0A851GQH0_9BACT|nr:NADPH-dependent FMN reductase [Oceaniferula marina]NWK57070.1 NAD(P)H-dependent oxidoreductase [Oceaniferula marina]